MIIYTTKWNELYNLVKKSTINWSIIDIKDKRSVFHRGILIYPLTDTELKIMPLTSKRYLEVL